ncbi:MAG: CidA/LrgA family protein [Lachnospiraceae bacterium]|nr:CidA/LrgA family protein [Lachnospiraceae bacterium]
MKYIRQFCIILGMTFLGEILHYFIPLPIPGSIYGLVLLFLALVFRIIPISSVKETGTFLIEIMPLMFIPAAAGLLVSWNVLQPILLPFLVISAVSTVFVMIVTGLIAQKLIRRKHHE